MANVGSYTEILVQKFTNRGVLIDTNLLLLYAVGSSDPSIIERAAFKGLAAYDTDDLRLVLAFLSLFSTRVTTPHVLAEVSNWIGYLPRDQKVACLAQFRDIFSSFTELRVDSLASSTHQIFRFLGLTDTAIAEVAKQYLVLTDDARLVGHLNAMGLEALNINHLRQELWRRG